MPTNEHNQLMTVTERQVFLEENKEWLGDLLVCEWGFLDNTEGIGMSDAETIETLKDRKFHNRPWKPPLLQPSMG